MARYIVGVTGASGIILGYRLVHHLTDLKHRVDLVMSRDAGLTASLEMNDKLSSAEKWLSSFSDEQQSYIRSYSIKDFMAPMASGSALFDGMAIIPCSMATLGAIAAGLADNLLRRAADVSLKERRKLVIVPRETPLSDIHLENMLRLSRSGAVILPPAPGWYTQPKTMEEMEDFIVGRVMDSLGVKHSVYPRWSVGTLKEQHISE
jgi:4-hydroxy-3-polyprenylbenzoate decarboxylase